MSTNSILKPYLSIELTKQDGQNTENNIKDNLISFTLNDFNSFHSNTIYLRLTGLKHNIQIGDTLTITFGGNDMSYGSYTVQTVAMDYKMQIAEICASSIDFTSQLMEKKRRFWDRTTLTKMSEQVAEENRMKTYLLVDNDPDILSSTQSNESDLVFLKRNASMYGYNCIVKNNTICIIPFAEENIEDLTVYTVDTTQCSYINIEKSRRSEYSKVIIEWQNLDKGIKEREEITNNSASMNAPIYYITNVYPRNPDDARKVAKAKMKELYRQTIRGRITLTDAIYIRSAGLLKIMNDKEIEGVYAIDEVKHKLSKKGYTVDISFSALYPGNS